MSIQISIGISTKLNSDIAGQEAARTALRKIDRLEPIAMMVFISTIFDQKKVLKSITSVIDDVPLIGCSSIASITHHGVTKCSVTVVLMASNSMDVSYGIGSEASKNPRLAGNLAAKKSSRVKKSEKQAYVMFSDCLSGNTSDILRGAQEIRGTGFPVIGGNSTDNMEFKKTYQYFDNEVHTDSVVGMLLGGAINVNTGKGHGWQPIGKPHIATRATSNIIKEIDQKRAVELYEEYLGKTLDEIGIEGIARMGINYPLGMKVENKAEYLTRIPIKINEIGNLSLNAEVHEGSILNLMIGDKASALSATKKACLDSLKGTNRSNIKFAMVFSSISRLQLLRNESYKEIELIKEIIGDDIPFFGCYTCGEYAPLSSGEYNREFAFHNQVISVTVISE